LFERSNLALFIHPIIFLPPKITYCESSFEGNPAEEFSNGAFYNIQKYVVMTFMRF